MATKGIDLKLRRVRANLTLTDLSAQINLSRQALWATERSAVVDPERARVYLAGLEALLAAKEPSRDTAA